MPIEPSSTSTLARLDQLFSDELIVNSAINSINDEQKVLQLLGAGPCVHHDQTRVDSKGP